MNDDDWRALSDAHFEKNATILTLVESLADEALFPAECKALREEFMAHHGVTEW